MSSPKTNVLRPGAMKIYSKIIVDIASGKTLSADYQEYHGPIAQCGGGGTTVEAPERTESQIALDVQQTEILRQQRDILTAQVKQQELLAPILFKQIGITPILSQTGVDNSRQIAALEAEREFQQSTISDPTNAAGASQVLSSQFPELGFPVFSEAQAIDPTVSQDRIAAIDKEIANLRSQETEAGTIIGFEEAEPGLREEIQQQSLELQREILELQRRELQTAEDLAPAEKQLREQQLEISTLALERQERLGPLEEDVETRQLERTLAALKGELPVNPALLRELDEQETLLREDLRRQLGPGFETSTPGRDALDNFFRQKEELLEGSRRADIRDFEALSLARGSLRRGDANTGATSAGAPFIAANLPSRFGDIFRGSDIIQNRSQSASQLSNVSSGFNAIAAQLQQDQDRQFKANIFNASQRSNTFGQIFQGVGSLAGFGIGLFCWIAEVLYGRNSNAFRAARYWIMFGWEGRIASVCRWTYLRFGERIAGFLRKRPIFQIPARLVFNIAVRRGTECFDG